MIRRSAPRPVMAPPTPAAKYSPPLLVSQRPAYTQEKKCPRLFMGGAPPRPPYYHFFSTRFNRDPCMTHLKCHTHSLGFC
jgi:hypothetical protein